jgi:hypothetical protein
MPMGDTASDLRVEFDRMNNGSHCVRFVYHLGATVIPTDYRAVADHWPAICAAAEQGQAAFASHMSSAYSPWWSTALPGDAERASCCSMVREILGLAA